MKERPILFSAPMVRAILEGKKTQTRRVLKAQPHPNIESKFPFTRMRGEWVNWHEHADRDIPMYLYTCKCPYGKPGDRLRVKEAAWMWCEKHPNGKTKTGRPKWHYVPLQSAPIFYAADSHKPTTSVVSPETGNSWGWRFKVGRSMPRWASRITLEITEVRVERLQEISENNVIAEGIDLMKTNCDGECGGEPCLISRQRFIELWKTINGETSWDANPWVWAITFKQVAA